MNPRYPKYQNKKSLSLYNFNCIFMDFSKFSAQHPHHQHMPIYHPVTTSQNNQMMNNFLNYPNPPPTGLNNGSFRWLFHINYVFLKNENLTKLYLNWSHFGLCQKNSIAFCSKMRHLYKQAFDIMCFFNIWFFVTVKSQAPIE